MEYYPQDTQKKSHYAPPRGRPGEETSPVAVVILSLVTCGIYYFYWYYKIRSELRDYTEDSSINPVTDIILGLVTCTLWFLYLDYTNGQLIASLQREREMHATDIGTLALTFDVVGLLVGIGPFISSALIQNELNRLWKNVEGY